MLVLYLLVPLRLPIIFESCSPEVNTSQIGTWHFNADTGRFFEERSFEFIVCLSPHVLQLLVFEPQLCGLDLGSCKFLVTNLILHDHGLDHRNLIHLSVFFRSVAGVVTRGLNKSLGDGLTLGTVLCLFNVFDLFLLWLVDDESWCVLIHHLIVFDLDLEYLVFVDFPEIDFRALVFASLVDNVLSSFNFFWFRFLLVLLALDTLVMT